jgi:DNA-nicking Smr family endonuclease
VRRLSPEDLTLWQQVAASVRPLRGRKAALRASAVPLRDEMAAAMAAPVAVKPARAIPARPATRVQAAPPPPPKPHANTLDAGWDKRLAKGSVAPDRTIDLHGHTLHSAHALLDIALGDAIRQGARLVLLITGRPARDNPRLPPTSRGVIRASVQDWIAAGPWSSQIAAIRAAHPRHGGNGALYVILRRAR